MFFGTINVYKAAVYGGAYSFVLVSTDKAVRPASMMGASKQAAELAVQVLAKHYGDDCEAIIVRFGNVMGSSGSVIPLWEQQIAAGGPVTVTEMGMMRYMMSIHDAVNLVVKAGELSSGTYMLDMGPLISMYELALDMVDDHDIEIVETGIRPCYNYFTHKAHALVANAYNLSLVKSPNILSPGTVSPPNPSTDTIQITTAFYGQPRMQLSLGPITVHR